MPKQDFQNLVEFIHEFIETDKTDVLDFMKIGYKRNIGDIVTIKNFVGLIQTKNGTKIQILPKIDFGIDEDEGNQNDSELERVFR
mgnify:CR=1 FL=1